MITTNMNLNYVTLPRRNTDTFKMCVFLQDSWELSSVLILELNSVRYLRLEKLSVGGKEEDFWRHYSGVVEEFIKGRYF